MTTDAGRRRVAARLCEGARRPARRVLYGGRGRRAYDGDLAEIVGTYAPDYVVLAGWMRILSMAFLQAFPYRVVNLHPALPGTFPGAHAIQDAFEAFQRGEIKETGIMVHLVPDEQVDAGPVLGTQTVSIYPSDTLAMLENRVHQAEHTLPALLRDGHAASRLQIQHHADGLRAHHAPT